jgi:hypothetical protein
MEEEKYEVHHHTWVDGVLTIIKRIFKTLKEALDFVVYRGIDKYKIYDHHGHVTHSHDADHERPHHNETYA